MTTPHTDPGTETDHGAPDVAPRTPTPPTAPTYKGEPLEAGRGPGLGCFWAQVVILGAMIVLTPIGAANHWPIQLTIAMFVVTLLLLLFAGQTVIFLLRLVSADRRSRRQPLRTGASRTVGQLEDDDAGSKAPPSVRQ